MTGKKDFLDDRDELLSLLAKKLDAKPKDVRFLFGINSESEDDIAIPDARVFQD